MHIPGPTPAQRARFAQALDVLAPAGSGPIIVGVSGGPDSLALLLLAASARHGEVIAATVDHRLRADSVEEVKHVAQLCRRFGIHHAAIAVKVDEEDSSGIQAAAREERYKALGRYAVRKGAPWLATAHHIDDQAETVMMRVARGAGVAGLAGVRDRRRLDEAVTVIRPVLGWRRAELAAIVSAARIDPVDDPSNRDPRYDRTHVRELLKAGWPDPMRLAAVGRNMADAEEALDWTARQLLEQRFVREDGNATLDTSGVPRELVRRLAFHAMRTLAPEDAVPRGDGLIRLLDRLEAGHVSTLGSLQVTPGAPWRFQSAPAHRSA
jgi:tRNA(Ile)-lysidine synthase